MTIFPTGLNPPPSSPADAAVLRFAAWGPMAALGAAQLIQGAAGRPAPPVFRPEIEGVIAALLIFAAGWRRPLGVALGGGAVGGGAFGRGRAPPWTAVGAGCLALLLWPPLARAAWAGWPAGDVIRDVIPLLFLFLPLVLVPGLRPTGRAGARCLALILMLEGLFFVLRWWRHAEWGFGAVGVRVMADGDGYLLNAPSALFAAVAWPLAALHCLEKPDGRRVLAALAALVAGGLCIAALLATAHRQAFALIVATAAAALWTRRRRIVWLWPALTLALVAGIGLEGERIVGAMGGIAEKNRLVGGNARMEEAAAALTAAGESLGGALFGGGWGARLENPAVGGWRVAYTHTFATYLLFKAGVVGLAAGIVWLAGLARAARDLWRRDPAWALAVAAPLIVAFTAHTSYKYLDTGVLLSLLMLLTGEGDQKSPQISKKHAIA